VEVATAAPVELAVPVVVEDDDEEDDEVVPRNEGTPLRSKTRVIDDLRLTVGVE